jgi:putative ABC transport system substrate-binding protein
MTRITLLSLLLCAVASLTPGTTLFAADKELKVAMILWQRGEAKAEQGFKEGLKELGYSVHYTILNAEQDRTKLGHILREELQPRLKEFDYIYTFGTTATKATKQIIADRVPQIFTMVFDPVGAGIVQSMDSPGGNISGASNSVSVALQLDTALKVIKFTKLGLLFNPREKNSALVREQLKELATSRHLEIVDLRSPPALDSLKENLRKLKDRSIIVDAVYLPADTFLVSSSKLIGSELRAAKIETIAAGDTYIDNGALIGLVADRDQIGKAAARIVDEHQKGRNLHSIPVYTQKDPQLMINVTTARALNVDIPKEVLAKARIIK